MDRKRDSSRLIGLPSDEFEVLLERAAETGTRRALLEARTAEDEATAIRGQVRSTVVELTQPAIDTAAIYAARNQNVR